MDEGLPDEVIHFLHRYTHLRARRGLDGYSEACMVADQCWPITEWPVPQWAVDLAAAGEPGSRWCPIITPTLLDRAVDLPRET